MGKSKKKIGWSIYPKGGVRGGGLTIDLPEPGKSMAFKVVVGEPVAVCNQPFCHIRLVALIGGNRAVLTVSPNRNNSSTFEVPYQSFVTIGAGSPKSYLLRLLVTNTNPDQGWVEFTAKQI